MPLDELLTRTISVIEKLQFSDHGRICDYCPACHQPDFEGHKLDCEIRLIIDSLREARKELQKSI